MTTPTKEDFDKAREIVALGTSFNSKAFERQNTLSSLFAQALAEQREKFEAEIENLSCEILNLESEVVKLNRWING